MAKYIVFCTQDNTPLLGSDCRAIAHSITYIDGRWNFNSIRLCAQKVADERNYLRPKDGMITQFGIVHRISDNPTRLYALTQREYITFTTAKLDSMDTVLTFTPAKLDNMYTIFGKNNTGTQCIMIDTYTNIEYWYSHLQRYNFTTFKQVKDNINAKLQFNTDYGYIPNTIHILT